jgi:hypothetical protein
VSWITGPVAPLIVGTPSAGEPAPDPGVQCLQPRRPRADFLEVGLVVLQHAASPSMALGLPNPSPAGGQEPTSPQVRLEY